MAGPKVFDRVKDTSTTTGTGTLTLANSAPTGYRTFGSVLSNNDTVLYTIALQGGSEWETGIGTYATAGPTLARTTVLASSNGGSAVNFSAGTKDVFCSLVANFPGRFLNQRDVYANLAAFHAGRVLWPTDGSSLIYDDGSAFKPYVPLYPCTPMVDGDFSWTNQDTASVATSKGSVYLSATTKSGNHSWMIRRKAAPSAPYTITVGLRTICNTGGLTLGGLCWRQSSDGKLVVFSLGHYSDGVNLPVLSVWKWDSPTAFNASYVSTTYALNFPGPMAWLRIQDDNTNRKCHISADGHNWMQIHSVGRTDFLTADQVGVCVSPYSGDIGMTIDSWAQA